MIGFIEYLINKGYKPYRKVMSKKGKCSYIEDNNIGFYSSMSEHIDLRLIKDNKEVIYGLHESNHSPTLIYPRPSYVIFDTDMDKVFLSKSFKQIAKKLNLCVE